MKNEIAKLSVKKRQQLESELKIELVRLRMGYTMKLPIENLRLEARVPIIGLTEWDFMERVRLMHGGVIIVRETINSYLLAVQN